MRTRTPPLAALALVLATLGAAGVGAASKATLTVKNETGYRIKALHRATEGEDWGNNLLTKGGIGASQQRDVTFAPGYTWLRAVFDMDGDEVEVLETADFEDGGEYVWTITDDMLWEAYDQVYGSDTYDTYGYLDTYGYYEDTYGYY